MTHIQPHKHFFLLLLAWFISASFIQVPVAPFVTNSIKSGNANKMATYFDKNVDITMNSNLNTYSKAQAEMVIQNFFKTNRIGKYEIQYTGSGGDSYYIIAHVSGGNKAYKVFFLLNKKGKNDFVIQSIKID